MGDKQRRRSGLLSPRRLAELSVADATQSRREREGCRSSVDRLPSADRQRDVERLLSPLEQDGHAISVLQILGGALEVLNAPDPLAVDLADQVATLEARLGRGAVLLDAEHDDSLCTLQVELAGDLGRDRPD